MTRKIPNFDALDRKKFNFCLAGVKLPAYIINC